MHGRNRPRYYYRDGHVLAIGRWTESPQIPGYYRDPVSGKLFRRHDAAVIERNRQRQQRKIAA
jgi:hypothetical protein